LSFLRKSSQKARKAGGLKEVQSCSAFLISFSQWYFWALRISFF